MPTSQGWRRGRSSRAWTPADSIQALSFVGLGLCLIWLAGDSLLREVYRVPVASYFDTYEDSFQAPADDGRGLERAVELQAEVPSWAQGAFELRRLGFLRLLERQKLAASGGQPDDGWLEAIRAPLIGSLEKEPIDPLSWAYLADAESAFGGDLSEAYAHLKTSYALAPVAPESALYRFRLAARLRAFWDADFQVMLRRDLSGLFPDSRWSPKRKDFVSAIKDYPGVVSLVGQLLEPDPAVYERFLKAVK